MCGPVPRARGQTGAAARGVFGVQTVADMVVLFEKLAAFAQARGDNVKHVPLDAGRDLLGQMRDLDPLLTDNRAPIRVPSARR